MTDRVQELINEAYATRREGRPEEALGQYRKAAEALRAMDAPLRLAHAVRHVADIERQMGLLADAERNYAEALAIYRSQLETGVVDLANTLRPYALLRQSVGDKDAARAMWTEAGNLYASLNLTAGVDEAEKQLHEL